MRTARLFALASAGIVGATTLVAGVPAQAASSNIDVLDRAVSQAKSAVGSDAHKPPSSTGIALSGGTVEIPMSGNAPLRVGVPFKKPNMTWRATSSGRQALASDDNRDSVVLAVEGSSSDRAQLFAVIRDKSAPSEYPFEISIDGGSTLTKAQNGGAAVVSADEKVGISIDPAWAVDAQGKRVPTRYDLRGNTLVQIVDPAGSYHYSIVADPSFKRRWFGGEIVFNHNETKAIAVGGAGAAGSILGSCSFIPVANVICGSLGLALGLNSAYFAAMDAANHCGKYYVHPIPRTGRPLLVASGTGTSAVASALQVTSVLHRHEWIVIVLI